tara:strand:- start:15483 stop:17042 length:1560 start_codon:yes stop_codon:yes gene_type:complete
MIITLIRFALVAPNGSVNNEPTPPIGLAYIASSCKSLGIKVEGIDATGRNLNKIFKIPNGNLQGIGIEIDEILKLINPKTQIFGISAMFTHEWTYIKDCLKKLKKKFPKSKIIAGGEHITALPEFSLRDCKEIDYACLGEGEETWSEITKKIIKKERINNIYGLAYIKKNKFIKNQYRERIKEVDKIPWPDWKIFPIEPYLDNAISFGAGSGRNMPFLASRGCPYECTFCSNPLMYGRRYYIRSVEDVIKEIKYYIKKYKITGLQFYDLTAIVKKDWIIEFCKSLKKNKINIEWSLPSGTRSEALDLEAVKAMTKANLKYLVYAPESGSAKTLKLIKKKIKLYKMEESIRYAIKNNVSVRTNLIIGFPHEKRIELYKTLFQQIKFMFMGVEESPTYPFQAYPGTELFNMLVKKKEIKLNDNYFNSLATLSTGKLTPPDVSYNEYIGKYELYFYRILGLIISYLISYLTRPKRIFRTIKSFFTDRSATVIEQRLKDNLKRSKFFLNYIKPFVTKNFIENK